MSDLSAAVSTSELDQLCVNTIRGLAMDAVEVAASGHPGMPMAMAPAAYVLYTEFMRHDPADPEWIDRDRFVLSAGHGSMLAYATLHLAGYEISLDDLKNFRQWGSLTPGHPERLRHERTPGIDTTTGPLGQGFANGVGMAMAEHFLRERFGDEIVDHRIFGICSDGDLMEGISAEAASLAGHLGLGRIVYLYDDNSITIDGRTDLSFGEDVSKRFEAYGWQVLAVDDVNDLPALRSALSQACAEQERPSLIRVRSEIGFGAPTKQNLSAAHGAPLGAEEVRGAKQALGLDPERSFYVDPSVYQHFDCRQRGTALRQEWQQLFDSWSSSNPTLHREWEAALAGKPATPLSESLPKFEPSDKPVATRAVSGQALQAVAAALPTMIGGSADLAASVQTLIKGEADYSKAAPGRNVHWGVREHAMAAAVNGIALHGGMARPYGSTFLVFADYMRPAIRLSALMELDVVWVFSHDSLGVGEDGPTHQPIEQLASLRAIPNLTVLRPADATETVECWRLIAEEIVGPVALILTRQNLPVIDRGALAPISGVGSGAYVLSHVEDPQCVLVATGSEVPLALAAQSELAQSGVGSTVVSMPSWELFASQSQEYRESVLPSNLPKVSIEAASTFGWERWVNRPVGIDRFGASAPGEVAMDKLGINVQAVVSAVRQLLS